MCFLSLPGIPKPRTTAERASALTALGPTSSIFKPTSNQQPAIGSAGRPAAPTASKLPVKGLATSLSSLSLGSNDNNGAPSKGVINRCVFCGVVSLSLLYLTALSFPLYMYSLSPSYTQQTRIHHIKSAKRVLTLMKVPVQGGCFIW